MSDQRVHMTLFSGLNGREEEPHCHRGEGTKRLEKKSSRYLTGAKYQLLNRLHSWQHPRISVHGSAADRQDKQVKSRSTHSSLDNLPPHFFLFNYTSLHSTGERIGLSGTSGGGVRQAEKTGIPDRIRFSLPLKNLFPQLNYNRIKLDFLMSFPGRQARDDHRLDDELPGPVPDRTEVRRPFKRFPLIR